MSLRILVADADGTLSGLMSRSLGRAGHQVTVVSDAAGVKAALGRGGRADVILVDPDLLGSRVGTVLEKRDQATVFLCSSRSEDDQRVQAAQRALGNTEYLKKPFSILDLEKRLSRLTPQSAKPVRKTDQRSKVRSSASPSLGNRARPRTVKRVEEASSDANVLRRLRREWRELEHASPREVLGIPAGVDAATAQVAVSRMLNRYGHLASDPSQSQEIRELAHRLADLISQAGMQLRKDETPKERAAPEPSVVPPAALSEEEKLLALGQRLIKAGSWEEADRVLTKANQLSLGDPIILACLGWARIHNPQLDEAERLEEGTEYLILGEQFGPKEVEGLIYLIQALVLQGRNDAALARAARGVKLAPDNVEMQRLFRSLKSSQ